PNTSTAPGAPIASASAHAPDAPIASAYAHAPGTPSPFAGGASNSLLQVIAQFRAAGMNMLRVGGTMVYESDASLDLCDANGILLWQDFMFANMAYPDEDATFNASVTAEARQQLSRLAGRPCLAILCGNSEGAQQAAM